MNRSGQYPSDAQNGPFPACLGACSGKTASDSANVEPHFVSATEAAHRLGITVTTLYDWLGQSDRGLLVIRGQRTTINYLQGGPKGQGRIWIELSEIERVRELMRVRTQVAPLRQRPVRQCVFPGITVSLGRPNREA